MKAIDLYVAHALSALIASGKYSTQDEAAHLAADAFRLAEHTAERVCDMIGHDWKPRENKCRRCNLPWGSREDNNGSFMVKIIK